MSEIRNRDGTLIARDGKIFPVRLGVYNLNTFNGLSEHEICTGTDSISMRITPTGGNADPGEGLLETALREDREEAGITRDTYPVHDRFITFFSRMEDDELEFFPQVGQPYKLRVFIRTHSTVWPQQQLPRPDERYPEVIRPAYRHIHPYNLSQLNLRPAFRWAMVLAEQEGMFGGGSTETTLDYKGLAEQWKQMNVHSHYIRYYCRENQQDEKLPATSQSAGIFKDLLHNLDKAAEEKHRLLQQKLPHDRKILDMLGSSVS